MAKNINLEEWLAENKSGKDQQLFLSEKQVRSFKEFENASDEEVINIINTLHQLSLITYEIITAELNQLMVNGEAA